MSLRKNGPGAGRTAPGAQIVVFGKPMPLHTVAIDPAQFALTWLVDRHRVRPELASTIALLAQIGGTAR